MVEWVLYHLYGLFSPSIEQRKQFYNFIIAKLTIWVWCGVGQIYRHLLTNHLDGKAAELCLANS